LGLFIVVAWYELDGVLGVDWGI
jgi:hypothetical protein